MLMKTSGLNPSLHDVDEKKGSYSELEMPSATSTGSGQAQWGVTRIGKTQGRKGGQGEILRCCSG